MVKTSTWRSPYSSFLGPSSEVNHLIYWSLLSCLCICGKRDQRVKMSAHHWCCRASDRKNQVLAFSKQSFFSLSFFKYLSVWSFFFFSLSWVAKTQLNHWTNFFLVCFFRLSSFFAHSDRDTGEPKWSVHVCVFVYCFVNSTLKSKDFWHPIVAQDMWRMLSFFLTYLGKPWLWNKFPL